MLRATLNLLSIVFFVFILGVLAAMGLRTVAETQPYQELDHPLIKERPWTIALGGDPTLAPAFSKAAYMGAAEGFPKVILGAPIQTLGDQTLVVYPTHFLQNKTPATFLGTLNIQDFRNSVPDSLTLEEFLQIAREHRIYLQLDRLQTGFLPQIVELVGKTFSDDEVLIASSSQAVKQSLKEKKPLWLYGATAAEMGKIKLFGSLFLEPIINIEADFIEVEGLPEHVRDELNRRHIRMLFTERKNAEDSILATQPGQLSRPVDRN